MTVTNPNPHEDHSPTLEEYEEGIVEDRDADEERRHWLEVTSFADIRIPPLNFEGPPPDEMGG